MQKISLKTVKNSLKRDEMRAIKGGSGRNCSCSRPVCSMYGGTADCDAPWYGKICCY